MAYIQKKVCKYCGRETDLHTDECPNCGAVRFVKATPPPPPPPSYTTSTPTYVPNMAGPSTKKKLIVSAAVIFGIIVLVYIVSSLFQPPPVALSSEEFIRVAESRGYHVYIEEDYDNWGTYWAGAYNLKPGVVKPDGSDDMELEAAAYYWIDYTLDRTISNARVEYHRFVNGGYNDRGAIAPGVRNMDTIIEDVAIDNYEYIIAKSATKFAIAYRIDRINILAVVPIEYEEEVYEFFEALGLTFE